MKEITFLLIGVFTIALVLYWEKKTKLKVHWIVIFSLTLSPFIGWLITSNLSIKHNNKRIKWVSIFFSILLIPFGLMLIYKAFTQDHYDLNFPRNREYFTNINSFLWGFGITSLGLYLTKLLDIIFLKKEYTISKNS